jgi:Predicted membrane protein (DUF2232)
VIFIAVLAAVLATLSPLWGLIFTLSFSGKYLNRFYLFMLLFVLAVAGLFLANVIDWITFFDVFIGIAVSIFIYFYIMQKSDSYLNAILAAAAVNCCYAIARQFIWGKQLLENVMLAMQNVESFLQSSLMENQEQLPLALELIESTKAILTKYYIGTWMVSIIFGLYFGSLLLSRQLQNKWDHRRIGLPFYLIYLLIVSLFLFILPQVRIIGINSLMILVPLFIIQGVSILDFFWRNFFTKSKFLLFLLIFSMALNIPILILVALVGMLDIWFDFRKIRVMEENDENHSG